MSFAGAADDTALDLSQPLEEWLAKYRGTSAPINVETGGRNLQDLVLGSLSGADLDTELKALGLLKLKGRRAAHTSISLHRAGAQRSTPEGSGGGGDSGDEGTAGRKAGVADGATTGCWETDTQSPLVLQSTVDPQCSGVGAVGLGAGEDPPPVGSPTSDQENALPPSPQIEDVGANADTGAHPPGGSADDGDSRTPTTILPSLQAPRDSEPAHGTTDLRVGNAVPDEVLNAYEKWTVPGVRPNTHKQYVNHVRKVFEHGVKKYGVREGSTLQEARSQLSRTVDEKGFMKAGLLNFLKFLDSSGSGSDGCRGGGGSDGCRGGASDGGRGGSTKREQRPENDRNKSSRDVKNTAAPVDKAGTGATKAQGSVVNGPASSDVQHEPTDWNCGKCTVLNAGSDTRCHVCLCYRARQSAASAAGGEQQAANRPKAETRKVKNQAASSRKPQSAEATVAAEPQTHREMERDADRERHKETQRKFSVGCSVKMAFEEPDGTLRYWPGTVQEIDSSGRLSISFVDGTVESGVDTADPDLHTEERSPKTANGTTQLQLGNAVPHEVLRAYEAWKEHGVLLKTHRAYVAHVRDVFEHGVKKYGLKKGSTLQEMRSQLSASTERGRKLDEKGFIKAGLLNFLKFLDGSGSGGGSGSSAKRRGEALEMDQSKRVPGKADKAIKADKVGTARKIRAGQTKTMTKPVAAEKRSAQGQPGAGRRKPTKVRRIKEAPSASDESAAHLGDRGSQGEGEDDSDDDTTTLQRSLSVQNAASDLLGLLRAAATDGALVHKSVVNAAESAGAISSVWRETNAGNANAATSVPNATAVVSQDESQPQGRNEMQGQEETQGLDVAPTNEQLEVVDGLLSVQPATFAAGETQRENQRVGDLRRQALNAFNTANGVVKDMTVKRPGEGGTSVYLRKPSLAAFGATGSPDTQEERASLAGAALPISASPDSRDELTEWT